MNVEDQRLQLVGDAEIQEIKLDEIKANPYQPRKTFDEEKLDDLAGSIKNHGVLQPIVVRKAITGYTIVVGERRFRASQRAGMSHIPAIVKSLTDEDMMELAIIENLQREDLNAIEEAESYKKLMTDLKLTQQQVAARLSKSRPYIANMLRLLHLPNEIAQMVKAGKLSGAHGRTLLIVKEPTRMKQIANQAIKESWSVRELESYVQTLTTNNQMAEPTQSDSITKPKFIRQQERQLQEQYGAKVAISTRNRKGHITFEFKSEEEFRNLIRQLNDKYNLD
ncbi:ParB/RepB/Spo0J family partition protein [Staphylococcus gallinarum]|jgi:ParB family chromosome partitioning protein|uniref:ParB/RepB/Spo0J family partition protein n=1 Tax=Staphylococcus gallinarum TaxID=1293 RepID=A0A2T4SX28_STAGA|nr:ParB/RepB/Spo0J family partition protein [Staphylococcus gallinarum]MCD8785762.1 ParB/RepB/Spo0J family partition protein [Staphylococcus gallinarum]MCD8820715.1 ParB/RepB/Spo0J family partition protein [Staphylococcus gallinarum]MCD8826366.1 ParB/RepB/Spo0J family partition protein [Staphylococcus gallinarum]MCD8829065.1 ParB/RepB/Spo0J family partition protein [Staphylococcus gallinarum]MCD8844220.1 ParB/RepB/Spo0J family partition protein [Staphylococcus gallinarum]